MGQLPRHCSSGCLNRADRSWLRRVPVGILLAMLLSASAMAQTNSWLNPGSGAWDHGGSWLLGVRPNSSQAVTITNANNKTVTISANTVNHYPASMNVRDILISKGNTLLLDNFGTNVPLRIKNTTLGNNSYNLKLLDGGKLINLNSALIIDEVGIGGVGLSSAGGAIYQDGGLIELPLITFFGGNIYVTNGFFKGSSFELGSFYSGTATYPGTFNQYGGTVNLGLRLDGTYNLHNGIFAGSLQGTPWGGSGIFTQNGGSNLANSLVLANTATLNASAPHYAFNAGFIGTGHIEIGPRGNFGQSGGIAHVTNAVTLRAAVYGHGTPPVRVPATYTLSNGTLSASSIVLDSSSGAAPDFYQSNGSASVGSLQFTGSSDPGDFIGRFGINSGTFSCSNIVSEGGAVDISQGGGTLIVSNVFSYAGYAGKYDYYNRHEDPRFVRYLFSGGTLTARNFELFAEMIIGSSTNAGRIANPGYFKLGGTLRMGNALEQLGRFILASNAVIDLGPGSAQLQFASSGGEEWNSAAKLTVTNWNGSLAGGGTDQLKFGSDRSGLTANQLSQILFVNPAGLPASTYAARVLVDGEVVPWPAGTLTFEGNGSSLELSWTGDYCLQTSTNVFGPFVDVPAATSPYTNNASSPHRFFQLRKVERNGAITEQP